MAAGKRQEKAKEEPRRAKRITRVLPLECKIIDFAENRLSKHSLSEGDVFGGRSINVSKTGLQVHSDYELDPKTLVEIQLSTKGSGKPKIRLTAVVAWARRNAFDLYGRWAMGMHIVKANPLELEKLEEFFQENE